MAFDEDKAKSFLAGGSQFNDKKAEDFLNGAPKEVIEPEAPELEPEQESGDKSILESAGDWAAGANDSIMRTLGLPADAANWALEKMGSDKRVMGTSQDVSEGMAAIGAGYEEGKEPKTGSYKAGEYTGMGLMFLAPFLRLGKGAAEMTAAPVTVMRKGKQVTGMQPVQESVGTVKGIAQRISAPFATSPKTSYLAELAGGTGAGYGAYYGKKNYGPTGEMVGGLAGGFGASYATAAPGLRMMSRYVKSSIFPYTEQGAKIKAANRLRTLAETMNVEETIAKTQTEMLAGTKISPAKLSGDRHMLALEKAVLKEDPELSHEFKMDQAKVNEAARREVEDLGGNARIEETQAVLQGRVERVKKVIHASVNNAVAKVQKSMEGLNPIQRRSVANKLVRKQIDSAMTTARNDEKTLWQSVDSKAVSPTQELKTKYNEHLTAMAKTADEEDIPKYVRTFLGDVKGGVYKEGKLKNTESVQDLSALRSRMLKTVREEKAKDVPNWNKVRILNDLQDSILRDIETTPASGNLTKAITFSRELNDKFSGGVMNSIMGHEKSGGKLASELTLEGIKNGPKAAVEINRILAASPKSLDVIEDYVKIQITQSNVIKGGQINLPAAKKYMNLNEEVMEIFPDLKRAMNNAIGAQERATWFTNAAKKRLKGLEGSTAAKLAGAKPGRVLNEILTSKNPAETMQKISGQLNETGRAGLKNDAADFLLGKSKTTAFDENNAPILSGRKFLNELKINREVFSKVFNKGEMKRLDTVAETMIKNEGMKDLPDIGDIVAISRNPLSFAIEIAAARLGAKAGAKSHGAALKTSSMFSNVARKILGSLDVGRAKQLIKDAIQDPELFRALITDHTTRSAEKNFMKVYHGWLAADAVQNISENN